MTAQHQQTQIDFNAVFEALERPLGLVEDPTRKAAFQRYLESARVHLERAVFDLLSGAVEAVNQADGNLRAHLEYQGGALHLVVEPIEDVPNERETFTIGDEVEKVTIRLPAELKELITQAAGLRGVSINSWYIRELARSVRDVARQARQDERQQQREARREQQEAERDQRREERQAQRGTLRGFVGEG